MAGEWVRYRRVADGPPLEAMHARFERHVYHRHSHETYSFGVTEAGAQAFTCRGGRHVSAAGMVMAFNPDETHDGRAEGSAGFTYRMVHIGPDLLGQIVADGLDQRGGRPLFAVPAFHDPLAARALRRLHTALMGPAPALERDERLVAAVAAVYRQAGRGGRAGPRGVGPAARAAAPSLALACRVRDHLHDAYLDNLGTEQLTSVTGHSRFAIYRSFRAVYGMSPAAYQRQLRLRAARDLIRSGWSLAEAATAAGFADQAHLTRWFVRCFGMTPGAYRRALAG